MDLMSLVTGGAQPQPSVGAPMPGSPDLETILRALAMKKMQGQAGEAPQAGFAERFGDMQAPQRPAPIAPMAAPATPLDVPGMDFSGRAKSPADIPLPRSDPRDAIAAVPDFPLGGPAPQSSMQSMVPTQESRGARGFLNAVAGGMPKNTAFKGGAFGAGFSGAIAGAEKTRSTDFDQSVKALDRVRDAAKRGDELAYKSALTDYYRALAQKAREGGTTATGAPAKSTERERLLERFKAAHKARTGEDLDDIAAWELLRRNPDVRDRLQAMDETARNREAGANARAGLRADTQNLTRNPPPFEERLKQSRQQQGLDETGRRPRPAETPVDQPQKPRAFKFGGEGTQASPATPKATADYNELPIGAYYQHPSDPPGKLRIKGKGPV